MNLYEVNRINDRLIVFGERLNEWMLNAMALIIGDKKAALIDSGMGVTGDLDQFVRNYTDLPIVLLCTHGDPDHIGSNLLFKDIYMSRLDDELIPWAMSIESRLSDLAAMTGGNKAIIDYAREHMVGDNRFDYKDIQDGDIFDLGGIVLEAVAVPGHSRGSMCFIDRGQGYVIAGDSINPMPWLWIDRCPHMSVYVQSVENFIERTKGISQIYCGHSLQLLPENIAWDIVEAGKEIMEGRIQNDKSFTIPFNTDLTGIEPYIHKHGAVNIVYNRLKYSI